MKYGERKISVVGIKIRKVGRGRFGKKNFNMQIEMYGTVKLH